MQIQSHNNTHWEREREKIKTYSKAGKTKINVRKKEAKKGQKQRKHFEWNMDDNGGC